MTASKGFTCGHTSAEVMEKMKELRLVSMAKSYGEIMLDDSFASLPPADCLFNLLKVYEETVREARYRKLRGKARIPVASGLDLADFAAGSKKTEARFSRQLAHIMDIMQTPDIRERRNVVISGRTGSGKTTFGVQILSAVLRAGLKAEWNDYQALVAVLGTSEGTEWHASVMSRICPCRACMLDDAFHGPLKPYELTVLKELLDAARNSGTVLIFATAEKERSWIGRPGNGTQQDSVMSRLCSGPVMVDMGDRDLRARRPVRFDGDGNPVTGVKDENEGTGGKN